jgi:hypothetical protein
MDRFDPNIPNIIQGDVTNVRVVDPGGGLPGDVGNLVVDPTKPFNIEVEWEVFEFFAPVFLAALGGNWDVSVYAESYGDSPELRIGTANVPASASVLCTVNQGRPNCRKFTATISVPANTLEEHTAGTNRSGIYKLVVCVFLDSNLGSPGFDLVGFREGPIIKAENPI